MEKWQENRNYRKIRDENGTVIANIITVDGRDVAVTADVFAAYAQMDRRERYLSEDLPTGKVLSMERLSTREYARRIGVTQRAVIKRRDRILRDMKKYFEKFAA